MAWFAKSEAKAIEQQNTKPPMFVLQVGIGKYLNGPKWADLRGSETDVDEMRKLLEGERFQIPSANVVTLKNEKATKSDIFSAFANHLVANAKAHFEKTKRRDAVILFQYSGHGSQAPDADGDEKDKLDETLVTYDSQDVQGKNFDITDDEIYSLTTELKKYTDNIVYVFDSCHSGSGTRNAEDARRLPARTTVPENVSMPGITTRSGKSSETDGSDGGVMPPGTDYIVISAAQADQLATQKYCFEECGRDKDPLVYGLLTFYLIDELKNARDDTSYREIMENVIRKVSSERPSQTPILEGDDRRTVFGSLGKTEDNFIKIVNVSAKTLRIRSGAIQGVSVGSVVSIYDKKATRAEDTERRATGRVTAVTATEAQVAIVSSSQPVTLEEKAIVASPDIGMTRSKVLLDGLDPNTPTDMKAIAAQLRSSFAPKNGVPDARGVDIAAANALSRQIGRWNIALMKDKYSKVFPNAARGGIFATKCYDSSNASRENSAESDVYYLAGQDFVPLFGFCVEAATNEAASVAAAAGHIEKALTHISKYRSVQSVQNRRSRLAGKVIVKPIRLISNSGTFTGAKNCIDSKFVADKYEPVSRSARGKYLFGPREAFWFEVTNNSPFDLYVSTLNLRSDGSIKVQFPRNIDGENQGVVVKKNGGKRIVRGDDCRLNADGDFVEAGALRTSASSGTDSFKFLVTASALKWSDLVFLEMDSIQRNESASLATNSEWIAVDLTFEIKELPN